MCEGNYDEGLRKYCNENYKTKKERVSLQKFLEVCDDLLTQERGEHQK